MAWSSGCMEVHSHLTQSHLEVKQPQILQVTVLAQIVCLNVVQSIARHNYSGGRYQVDLAPPGQLNRQGLHT